MVDRHYTELETISRSSARDLLEYFMLNRYNFSRENSSSQHANKPRYHSRWGDGKSAARVMPLPKLEFFKGIARVKNHCGRMRWNRFICGQADLV